MIGTAAIDIATIRVMEKRRKFISCEVFVYHYSKFFMIHEPYEKTGGYVLSTNGGHMLVQIASLSKLRTLCHKLDKFIDANYNGNFLRATEFNMLRWHNGIHSHPKFKWLARELHAICTRHITVEQETEQS